MNNLDLIHLNAGLSLGFGLKFNYGDPLIINFPPLNL